MKRPAAPLLLLLIAAACVLAGCVSDGPSEPRKPRIPPQPRDARADVVLLNLAPPTDSDGDTAPDTFVASVHLFDERHQLPVRVDGTLRVDLLRSRQEEPIQSWTLSPSELRARVVQAQVGPVYRIRLEVPRQRGPILDRVVDIRCTFTGGSGQDSVAWHRGLTWSGRAP